MNASRIERIVAPNPSPMTLEGTNSYLVFGGAHAIAIDPGPPIDDHVAALVAAAARRGATIAAIAVTHGHPDHAPAAALLHARTGAPVHGHERATFPTDRVARAGTHIVAGDARLETIDGPGHTHDHLAFYFRPEAALFTGDIVIGRGTVVIAPPSGDMRAYQATLARLRRDYGDARTIFGGHGDPVRDPRAKFDEYLAQRRRRERDVVAALAAGEHTIPDLVAAIYRDTPEAVWPAAARQILAHVIALESDGIVVSRDLARAPTAFEASILDPDLARIVGDAAADVARAEFGLDASVATLRAYALRR